MSLDYRPLTEEDVDPRILEKVKSELTVYAGPMTSGKSWKLIEAIDQVQFRYPHIDDFSVEDWVLGVKPKADKRDNKPSSGWIRSRGSREIEVRYPATVLDDSRSFEMLDERFRGYPFIAIDEGQFWSQGLKLTVQMLLSQGREVYVAGLSADFRVEPFGEMGDLLAIADHRPQLTAIDPEDKYVPASRTQRVVDDRMAHYDDPIIVVGDTETYMARSPQHHTVPGKHEALQAQLEELVQE